MSKDVEDAISDNFCLKKFPQKPAKKGGGKGKKKMLALRANSSKFCIHNLWVTSRLEMQTKTNLPKWGGGQKMKILSLGANSTKFVYKNKDLRIGLCTRRNCNCIYLFLFF